MSWNIDTQPLAVPLASSAPVPDTFVAYLQRHNLTIPEAARLSALPSLLVWRVSKWLPIAEESATILVWALGKATGETFHGFVLTTRVGTRPKATRFLG